MTENLLEDLLRKNSLGVTKGRKEVLRLMQKGKDEPMEAEQVYDLVPREICSNLSTAHCILDQPSEKGLLKSVLYQNGIMCYQYNSGEHRHYIVYSKYGKVAASENCLMDAFDNYIRKDTGFDVTGHVFELTGLCPDCKEKIKSGKWAAYDKYYCKNCSCWKPLTPPWFLWHGPVLKKKNPTSSYPFLNSGEVD